MQLFYRLFPILILLLFFNFVNAQESDLKMLDSLFNNDEYQKIVDILEKKDSLTNGEEIKFTRSLGRLGQYSNALVLSNKLIERFEFTKDTTQLVIAYNLKSENLIDLDKIDEGLEFCSQILPTFRVKDSIQLQLLFFKWGAMHLKKKNHQEAYEVYNKITTKRFRDLPIFLNNYGALLTELKKWDEALVLFKKSIDLKIKSNSLHLININFANTALVYINKKEFKKAEEYLILASNVEKKYTHFASEKAVFNGYYNLYATQGNTIEAKKYLDSIAYINEKIFTQRLNEKLGELDNLTKRENSLKKKVKIIDNELVVSKKQKLWIAISFIVLALILSIAILLLRLRNIKSKNSEILLEQKLLRSQMTPHFIFNSLSVLQGIILNKEEKKSISYLSKFSKLLRIILENSREKVVPLKQEIAAIENYLSLQNLNTNPPYQYTIFIDEHINVAHFNIPPMLIQPFVENAIEHAFGNTKNDKKIDVSITYKEKKLICTIADNGMGIKINPIKNNKKDKKSLATTITSERLEMLSKDFKIKGRVTVEDRKKYNQQGTLVTLVIPYKNSNK